MAKLNDQQLALFEFAPEPEAKFTRSEYDEIMGWRVARMKEGGTFPSFEEVNAIVTKVLAEYAPKSRTARNNRDDQIVAGATVQEAVRQTTGAPNGKS
jgi:hypothetical protein